MNTLTLTNTQATDLQTLDLNSQSFAYYEKGLQGSANTQIAYAKDVEQYLTFVGSDFSMQGVCNFLSHLSITPARPNNPKPYSYSSIVRKLASIRKYFEIQNISDPTDCKAFKTFLVGLGKTIGKAQTLTKACETAKSIKSKINKIPTNTIKGIRDKALILTGFAGAFRRGELESLTIENLVFSDDYVEISYFGSKTNQFKEKETKFLFRTADSSFCPVKALKKYIGSLGRETGALFVNIAPNKKEYSENRLSAHSINEIVKSYFGEGLTAHSLRASFVTIARNNGSPNHEIKAQTKHKTDTMIDRYYRNSDLKNNNAAKNLGL